MRQNERGIVLCETQESPPKMKTCGGRCGESKPLSEFGRNAYYERFGAKDGRAIYCSDCNRKTTAARTAVARESREKIAPLRKPTVLAKKPKGKKEIRDGTVDAGLLLLLLMTPKGVELTTEEIAFVCGCSVQRIRQIQMNALKKLQRHASQLEMFRTILPNGSEYSYGVSSIYFAA